MSPASSSTTAPVADAGIITHAARGRSSLATKSARDSVPVAPSPASSATESAPLSYTTQSWPSRMSRRTSPAPIRPRPTIPSCAIAFSLS